MNSGLYQLQARWFGAGKVLRNPGAENLRRPIHLHPLYKQPVPDARIPLEGRTFLLPERGGKVVPFQTIVRYHRPARFGVQLVFLDSDVRLDLLLPDHASVAPGNFGGVDLEHVACRALKANRFEVTSGRRRVGA